MKQQGKLEERRLTEVPKGHENLGQCAGGQKIEAIGAVGIRCDKLTDIAAEYPWMNPMYSGSPVPPCIVSAGSLPNPRSAILPSSGQIPG